MKQTKEREQNNIPGHSGQVEPLVRAQTPPWFRSWYVRELMIMHGIPFSEKKPNNKKALSDKQNFSNILTSDNPFKRGYK